MNPPVPVPETLSDSEGVAYAVFTPVEGGSFIGDGYSLSAGPGAVANGEYIGISMTPAGDASNVGKTWHRYTLGGSSYSVDVIDSSGVKITDYVLTAPASVCVPMPVELGGNIADIVMVSTGGDGGLTVLSTRVRILPNGVAVCGNLSSLPATVAVGEEGVPPEIIEEAEGEAIEQGIPDTGGATPALPLLLLVLILATCAVPVGVSMVRRVRTLA